MNPSKSLIPMQMVGVEEKTDDIVRRLMNKAYKGDEAGRAKAVREYQKARAMEHLMISALEQGWEMFEWKRAHEEGMLCQYDYDTFEGAKKVKNIPSKYSKYIK